MPNIEHEFPLDLVRRSPETAVQLLRLVTNEPLPDYERVRCEASEATVTAAPAELVSDSVVVLERREPVSGKQRNVLAVITEPQNGRDKDKRFSWPCYVANMRHRLRCEVVLLVLAPDESIAQWASAPIDLGRGRMKLRPLALPLTELPLVRDEGLASKAPELTVLGAGVHAPADQEAVQALSTALRALDESVTSLYSDYVLAALPAVAKRYLEELMSATMYRWRSEIGRDSYAAGEEQGKAEGKAAGKAEGESVAVLAVLDSRGVVLSEEQRERIHTCSDLDLLDSWVRRAGVVDSAAELFD